ncbi:hypothetical protein [Marinigracilibium pacificum]|uniref:Uncharacterized protein n=1 Tax=Marinigracilibium pacificum TaxID=2729599 RepID=A0A848ISN9_9BACT|nr:hypothetical protein [Marinigracilibium pacificum]NMM47453.1 hypothetical protein [Marinigracilibium pacificum]
MGFNISAIAIDSSYEDKLTDLQNDLNLTLEYVEDVTFEEASSNWTGEGEGFLYFAGDSTILFLPMEMCIEPFPIKGKKVLSFALSEMSMAFCLNFWDGEKVSRYIMEHEGDIKSQEGTPFDFEATCGDTSEVIWKKLDDTLDISFHSIDLGAKAKKYKVSLGKPINKQENQESEKPNVGSKEHQAEIETKYRQFTNEQLQAEFIRILSIPNARTNVQCLVEVAALMTISKERGIDLQNFNKKKDNKGCFPVLVTGIIFVTALIFYLL